MGSSWEFLLQAFQIELSGVAGNFFPTKNSQDGGKKELFVPFQGGGLGGIGAICCHGNDIPRKAAGGGEGTPEIH